jgi:RHS repeat-associated protein
MQYYPTWRGGGREPASRSIPERSGVGYPYGAERWNSGTLPTDYRFTGQRYAGYIKLYAMGARWYDYYLNRFVQPDTIIPQPENPQSLNRYSYVYNNPLVYRDKDGHFPVPWDPVGAFQDMKEGFKAGLDAVKALAVGDFDEAGRKWFYASVTASGMKPDLMRAANWWETVNSDMSTIFSGRPLKERVGPAVRQGINAVGIATLVTGFGGAVGGTASQSQAQPMTRLYRAVGEEELQQLMETGVFQSPGSAEGKYFATTLEDAMTWGERLMGEGNYRVIQLDLPSELVEQFYAWERLDTIGPAYYATLEQLKDLILALTEAAK